ncbi:MAG: hypothetical protein LBB56_04870 [Chitinispirillales bacterium]|jgi:hypothetical protein|nr:hypothetical protein [Chitinispirillales bacterium]
MSEFTEKQKRELIFFKDHLTEFLNDDLLKNKYVIISNEKIQNSFDTLELAVTYAVENFQKGDYIIQQIINEDEVINFVKAAIV